MSGDITVPQETEEKTQWQPHSVIVSGYLEHSLKSESSLEIILTASPRPQEFAARSLEDLRGFDRARATFFFVLFLIGDFFLALSPISFSCPMLTPISDLCPPRINGRLNRSSAA